MFARMSSLSCSLVFASAVVGAGCAAVQVAVEHDDSVDFATYETYAWLEEPRRETGNPIVDDNALMDRRVQAIVDEELTARGLVRKEGGGADLTIHFHAMLAPKTSTITTREYDETAGTRVLRAEHTMATQYTEGTLLLDMHDSVRDELVWRGKSHRAVDRLLDNPERAQAALRKVVREMLKDFPPTRSR